MTFSDLPSKERFKEYQRDKIALRSLILVALLTFITGCKDQDQAWQDAIKKDSPESYHEFLQKYPKGKYNLKASGRLKELINKLHRQAYVLLDDRTNNTLDDNSEVVLLYQRILKVSGHDALALNNLAWIECARYYEQDEPVYPKPPLSIFQITRIEKAIHLLEEARSYVKEEKVSSMLAFVIEGDIVICARDFTEEEGAELNKIIAENLETVKSIYNDK